MPQSKVTGSPSVVRALASIPVSIAFGAAIGRIASIGIGAVSVFKPIDVIVGAIVGLVLSPALAFALLYGSWLTGIVLIAVPTAAAAYLGGVLLGRPGLEPGPSLILSITVYLSASIVRGAIGWRRHGPRPPGVCVNCRYSRHGLPAGAVCPECGAEVGGLTPPTTSVPTSPH